MNGRTVSPDGKRRLAITAHLNPLNDVYIQNSPPNFPIDDVKIRRDLDMLMESGLPFTINIFSGKFFSSRATDYLNDTTDNIMVDQFGTPMKITWEPSTAFPLNYVAMPTVENGYLYKVKVAGTSSATEPVWPTPTEAVPLPTVTDGTATWELNPSIQGDTFFSIAPAALGTTNGFLTMYETNIRRVAQLIKEYMDNHKMFRDNLLCVSLAGEMKYPFFSTPGGQPRWGDYGVLALRAFRTYAGLWYYGSGLDPNGNAKPFSTFNDWAANRGLPANFTADNLQPPKGTTATAFNVLEPTNPYFMDWHQYRIYALQFHMRECLRWITEEGLVETPHTKVYSHQAVWGPSDAHFYRRGAPIEHLKLKEYNPVVSLFGNDTGASSEPSNTIPASGAAYEPGEPLITDVENIALGTTTELGKPVAKLTGRWGTLQYNPQGPKDMALTPPYQTKDTQYAVSVYLERLKMLERHNVRLVATYGWNYEDARADSDPTFVFRPNFQAACRQFMAGAG